MRGYLKDHVGVFEPDEVVILLAAFDNAWGAVQASGVRYPAGQARICAGDTREAYYCGRNERRTRRGPAARRCSTRLGSIKSAKRAGEQTQLAERRRKRSSGDPALPGAYALWALRAGCSMRNLWPRPCVSQVESSNRRPNDEGLGRGSRLGARVGNPTNGTCVSSSGADREADVGSGPCAIPPP
jgi:hypothetical protein